MKAFSNSIHLGAILFFGDVFHLINAGAGAGHDHLQTTTAQRRLNQVPPRLPGPSNVQASREPGPTKYHQDEAERKLGYASGGDSSKKNKKNKSRIEKTDLDTISPTDLVEILTGGSPDHIISNVRYSGATKASGSFTVVGDTDIVGFKDGIVMTTGAACNVQGPNDNPRTSHVNGEPGDADLEAQIPGYYPTFDAAVLEFDYECKSGKPIVNVEYVFGSEEYNEFVNQGFNDVFGFFVNGIDIAVIPTTGDQVSIDTIHCNNGGSNCDLFIDNTGKKKLNTELDGLTKVLRAVSPPRADGKYHVKIAIADTGDYILDSAVFIKAGSFMCQTPRGDVTGDPHFKTWTGLRYDYHGACDLVLVQNPLFANGLGMHIHVRTKLQGTEGSYIQSVAVKIGNDILEVKADQSTRQRQLWLNGVAKPKGSLEEISISGFSISYRKESHDLLVKKRHVYIIELSKTEHIIIKSFKHLLNVHFSNATNEHFHGSLGLLGSFDTGLKVGRDGKTVFEDDIRFGEEWQVLGTELMLFHEVDGPQHPGTCSYVNVVEKHEKLRQLRKLHGRGRRLSESISRDEAVEACSVVNEENRANCIFDVLSLSDLDMVALYMEDDTEASVFAH